jgi:UDP-N-acetylglucosamine transferase subunit ALG13
MIFVCTGTQVYQFNRLLKELDKLVEDGQIKDEIFAQIGASDYKPQHYAYKEFLSSDEFKECQDKATLIISHGGTGALIGASKKGKNIIAVPRLAQFGEHTDDHQLQIVDVLKNEGYVRAVYDMKDLECCIKDAMENPISKKYERESNVICIIEEFIKEH